MIPLSWQNSVYATVNMDQNLMNTVSFLDYFNWFPEINWLTMERKLVLVQTIFNGSILLFELYYLFCLNISSLTVTEHILINFAASFRTSWSSSCNKSSEIFRRITIISFNISFLETSSHIFKAGTKVVRRDVATL